MSENIIIQQSGFPEALTVDALRMGVLGSGSEDWVFSSGEVSSFIKMAVGKNVEIDASDYDAQAITEVDVTQATNGIETQPDEAPDTIGPRNVSISEGNQPRIISPVKKVRVNLQAGGTIDLLPKSSIVTGTLYAAKRGHYAAKNDGYVGYSKVYVDVPESIDGTGEDGGWTDLPDEIRVTTPPTKTTYSVGETIDYTGMVVVAYKNSQIWQNESYPNGVIPINELLELPVSVSNVLKINDVDEELCPSGLYPWKQPAQVGSGGFYYAEGRNLFTGWYDSERIEYNLPNNIMIAGWMRYKNNKFMGLATRICAKDEYVGAKYTARTIYKKNGNIVDEGTVELGIDLTNATTTILNGEEITLDNISYERAKREGGMYFICVGSSSASINSISRRDDVEIETNIPGLLTQTFHDDERSPATWIEQARIFRQAAYGLQDIDVLWERPRDGQQLTTKFGIKIN